MGEMRELVILLGDFGYRFTGLLNLVLGNVVLFVSCFHRLGAQKYL